MITSFLVGREANIKIPLVWEDSVEILSSLYWTPAFAATFKQMHGYDIEKYTMLLSYNNGLQFDTFYPTRFVSSTPTLDYGIIADYRATLSCSPHITTILCSGQMIILAYHSQDKWDTTCRLTWRVL